MSLLKISEILGLFVNMLTADENLSFQNRENLPQQYPMQLSKKTRVLSEFFAAFLRFRSNFEHFGKKDEPS